MCKNYFNFVSYDSKNLLVDKEALDHENDFFSSVGERIEEKINLFPPPVPPDSQSEDTFYDLDCECFFCL